jgi:chromosome segregation ATPase
MIFKKEDMHEVDADRIKQLEMELQKKSIELNNLFKHLEEKNSIERFYKQDQYQKDQKIIKLEKEKFTLSQEIVYLKSSNGTFTSQLKELQEQLSFLKSTSSKSQPLTMDTYSQTPVLKSPQKSSKPTFPIEVPTKEKPKHKTLAKKPSQKSFKKPTKQLQFQKPPIPIPEVRQV